MIGALAVIGLLHGLCAGLGVPAGWTPHFAAAATLWFGIRAADRTGVVFALLAGLIAGLFSSLAWAVEPLVCMVVFALTGGMRNARLSDGYSRAVFLAESRLAAVGVERPMVSGEDGGSVGQDLQWRVSIRQVDDQGGPGSQLLPLRLYEVRVQVRWAEDGRDRQFALNSLRLGPPQ